jgi:hypothetical protein
VAGERGYGWSIHHRRGRDSKPDSNMPQNLITLCGADNVSGCHGYVHQHGAVAAAQGWRVTRIGVDRDPLTVPVQVHERPDPVYLTADGRYVDRPDG